MDFVQLHFPIIKDILRKVVDVLDIADDSEATSSIEDLNNTVIDIDTTLVKDVDATLVKEVPAQTYPLPETPSTSSSAVNVPGSNQEHFRTCVKRLKSCHGWLI